MKIWSSKKAVYYKSLAARFPARRYPRPLSIKLVFWNILSHTLYLFLISRKNLPFQVRLTWIRYLKRNFLMSPHSSYPFLRWLVGLSVGLSLFPKRKGSSLACFDQSTWFKGTFHLFLGVCIVIKYWLKILQYFFI